MDALFRINREDGITVMCNLHDLDIAAKYCDRLIGMSAGKVVFDDVPQALTREIAAELYGIEAKDAGAEALDALDAIAASEAKRARQKIA
jgi:phosphonate transport system ATP-binding protein